MNPRCGLGAARISFGLGWGRTKWGLWPDSAAESSTLRILLRIEVVGFLALFLLLLLLIVLRVFAHLRVSPVLGLSFLSHTHSSMAL